MEVRFDGKSALVTGAGQGIGRGIAEELHRLGATVYAQDINEECLQPLLEECPDIRPVYVDLRDWAETRTAVGVLGAVDLLVNHAAIYDHESILDTDEETYDRVMSVNVKANFNVSQVVVSGMIREGIHGAIVHIGSLTAMVGSPFAGIYGASKAAVLSLTKSMAKEFGPKNIRVNAVCPGLVKTDLSRPVWEDEVLTAWILASTPMNRHPEIKDVVNAVMFLLSDKSAMTNGVVLPIDGGFL